MIQGQDQSPPRAPATEREVNQGPKTVGQSLGQPSIVITGCQPNTAFLLFTPQTRPSDPHGLNVSSLTRHKTLKIWKFWVHNYMDIRVRRVWVWIADCKSKYVYGIKVWSKETVRETEFESHSRYEPWPYTLIQLEMGRGQTGGWGGWCGWCGAVPTRQKEMSYCGPDLIYDSDSSQTCSSNQIRTSLNMKLSPLCSLLQWEPNVKTNTWPLIWHKLTVKKHGRGSNNKQKPIRWKNQIEFRLVSSQWPTLPRARDLSSCFV